MELRMKDRCAGRITVALLALAALTACADFKAAMAQPNSRVMTLNTLSSEIKPGMASADVLARIGRPAYSFPIGRQGLSIWNYRFARPEGDCAVFQISVSNATGRVTETGQGPDRECANNRN